MADSYSKVVCSIEDGKHCEKRINEFFQSNDLVEVSVGDRQTPPWVLSRDFLFTRLPALRIRMEEFARNNPDQDLASSGIYLKKVEAPVFAIALDWLLTGRLECLQTHAAEPATMNHFALWCSLHVFAQTYGLPELSRKALERLRKCIALIAWYPTPMEVRYVFNETLPNDPLRSIMVDEVTKLFVRRTIADFKEHTNEWVTLLNSNSVFHERVMLGIKRRLNARTVRLREENIHVRAGRFRRTRSRQRFREVIDLTGDD